MRLLMTTDTVGGVWTFTRELAAGLLERGCGIVLVSFGQKPSAGHLLDLERLRSKGDVRYVPTAVPLEWMPQNNEAYSGAEALLLQLCSEIEPDALLLSQYCFGALPVAAPKIVIAHSDVLSWAAALGRAPLPEDDWLRTYRALVQRGLDGAAMLVAPTAAALAGMAPHFQLPRRTAVTHNGTAIPTVGGPAHRRLQAVTAGRMWDSAKNLQLLTQIRTSVPVLVAGEHGSGDTGALRLLGRQSQDELFGLFRESAIYICSSLYEPFGLAPLEAALCGCAVIVNDIPSLREVWGDAALYVTGAPALGHLLDNLARNPERLLNVQHACNDRARQFTRDRLSTTYLQNIASTVAAHTQEPARAA